MGLDQLAESHVFCCPQSFAWTTKMRTCRGDQNDNETITKTIRNCSKKHAVWATTHLTGFTRLLKTEMCGMVVLFSFSSLPALPQLGFCHVFTTQDCLCLAAASFERSWSRTWCNFRSKKAMSRTPCPNLTDQKKSCRKLVKCWDASRLWSMSKIAHRTICFDLPRTILSHPWKPGKFTLLVYRELTTWENDKRKKTITWFWVI